MSPVGDLNITQARSRLSEVVEQVHTLHHPVYVTRRGRRVAAVIDADDLDELAALAQDMADIRAAEQAREEMRTTGQTPVPWEQVKADLGLA